MSTPAFEHYGTHDWPVQALTLDALASLAEHFAEQLTGDPHAKVTLVVAQDLLQRMENTCSVVVERPVP
jgi:hypothetical protein